MTAGGRRSELRSPKIGKKGGFLRIAQELRKISGHGFQDSVAFVDARILKKIHEKMFTGCTDIAYG